MLSRSGYGVTRSHKRGGNVTSGGDGIVVNGIVRECKVEHCRAELPLPQPLRISQGPTVQEVPKEPDGKAGQGTAAQCKAFSHRRREQSLRQLMEGHTRRTYATDNAFPKLERTGEGYRGG